MKNELFHYTTAQTALEYILAKKELRFSQMQFTNDPRETKEIRLFSLSSLPPPNSEGESFNRVHRAAKSVKLKEWKVLCFSQNHPDLVDGAKQNNPFLRGNYRPAMWAHYASSRNRSHDGVCLKFELDRFNKRVLEKFNAPEYAVYSGAVEYSDEKILEPPPFDYAKIPLMSDTEIKEHVRIYFSTNFKEIFLIKPKDWENEHEFRWLVHSPKDDYEYVSINETLEEVMVGKEFPKVYEPSLIKLCEEMKIPAKRIGWFNGFPYEDTMYLPDSTH